MNCFEAFIGYLPDIIPGCYLCGISPFIGIGLLNLITSSNSAIATSIDLFLMNAQIYIACFLDIGNESALTDASVLLVNFGVSFFFSSALTSLLSVLELSSTLEFTSVLFSIFVSTLASWDGATGALAVLFNLLSCGFDNGLSVIISYLLMNSLLILIRAYRELLFLLIMRILLIYGLSFYE